MKKIIFFLICIVLSVFMSLNSSSAAELTTAQKQELTNKLTTNCWDKYKDDLYNKKGMTVSEVGDIDFATPDEVKAAHDNYSEWAQINVDLLACYKQELAGYPDLIAQVETNAQKANQQMTAVNSFDFQKLITPKTTANAVIKIPAKTTKISRMRTFCLDTGRGVPWSGEEYYLAGSVDELNRKGVCNLLAQAANGGNMDEIQGDIWETQKLPITKTIDRSTNKITKPIAETMVLGGLLLFITFLILGRFFKSDKRGLHITLKIVWAIILVGLLGVTGYGAWRLYDLGFFNRTVKKTFTHTKKQFAPIQTTSGKKSLVDASRSRDVIVTAYSTGGIRETDVKITNNTNKDLELDASCIYFIPKQSNISLTANISKWFKSIIAYAKTDSGKMNNDSDLGTQRLGSAGETSDGPPQPDTAPEPDDILKNLTDKAKEDLSGAMDRFNKNPTEDNLKDAFKGMQECQAVGCGDDQAAFDDMGSTWQDKVDNDTNSYNNNPTDGGRDNLQRDSELCQILNCDPSNALSALGL